MKSFTTSLRVVALCAVNALLLAQPTPTLGKAEKVGQLIIRIRNKKLELSQ